MPRKELTEEDLAKARSIIAAAAGRSGRGASKRRSKEHYRKIVAASLKARKAKKAEKENGQGGK